MTEESTGRIVALQLRPGQNQPTTKVSSVTATAGGGLAGDHTRSAKRGVTILAVEGWDEACREIGVSLAPELRRANVMVSGIDLSGALGRELLLGAVRLKIHGLVLPCGHMETLAPGLKQALNRGCRMGIHGEVLVGGTVSVGDTARVLS